MRHADQRPDALRDYNVASILRTKSEPNQTDATPNQSQIDELFHGFLPSNSEISNHPNEYETTDGDLGAKF